MIAIAIFAAIATAIHGGAAVLMVMVTMSGKGKKRIGPVSAYE